MTTASLPLNPVSPAAAGRRRELVGRIAAQIDRIVTLQLGSAPDELIAAEKRVLDDLQDQLDAL